MSLKAVVEAMFAAEYLFDDHHKAWREIVAPASHAEGNPFVDIELLLGSVEVCGALSGQQDQKKAIADSLVGSDVLEVDPSGARVRRRHRLDATQDPELRTVFAKPIPVEATDDMVKDFFAQFGRVDRVVRRTFLEDAQQKRRPSVFVVYSSVAEAQHCIASKPSYGTLPSKLASCWIPRLTVTTKESQEQRIAEDAERDHQKTQRMILASATEGSATPAAPTTTRFIRPGCALCIPNLPKTVKWGDVKTKLMNLAVDSPQLKKNPIKHVQIQADAAFVIFHTSEAAEAMLIAYHTASGPHVDSLKVSIPTLRKLTPTEDSAVVKAYPLWTEAQASSKIAANAAHKRKREGDAQ